MFSLKSGFNWWLKRWKHNGCINTFSLFHAVCIWSSVFIERDTSTILWIKSALLDTNYKNYLMLPTNTEPHYSKAAFPPLLPSNYLHCVACCHFQTQQQGQLCHSQEPLCFCISVGTVLNIWTLLIKSYLDSVLLSLTDSKVIKLLKGVTGKIVVSRLRQERLIKWPLLLLTSSKAAFFYSRQANERECFFFFLLHKMCECTEIFFLH